MSDSSAPARTAVRTIAAALLRHVLTGCGLYLAHRGWVDQATADSAVGPIAEELLGAGTTIFSACWAVAWEKLSHTRLVRAWIAPARALPPA